MARVEFDPEKSERNLEIRGIPFTAANNFQWETAFEAEDTRQDYGESRYTAIGYIGDVLHVLVYTPREGARRVISLRRANERERRGYADKAQNSQPGTD